MGIGSFLLAMGKSGFTTAGSAALGGSKIVGKALYGIGAVMGTGLLGATNLIGTPIAPLITSSATRNRAVSEIGETFKTAGRRWVKDTEDGGLAFTVPAKLAIGGMMTYSSLRDIYPREVAERMGTVDRKPTTTTPDIQPKQYERHPPNRITYNSGGATGDLVFALFNNR